VVAGLIAAVKLARVESREYRVEARVRSAISDSIAIALMVVETSKANQ
jgi:hypothetical protein